MSVGANAYVSDNDEQFSIYNQSAIIGVLQELVENKVPLSAAFNAGNDVLVTVALHVDPSNGVLYLDVNGNEQFNQQLLSAKNITFHALLNGAKVMWTCTVIEASEYQGYRAFEVWIPQRLQRIQRRGSYRVNTPVTRPVLCFIPLGPGEELSAPLFDMCVEGIGVILPPSPSLRIQKFADFRNCRLEHADLGVLIVSLVVKGMWEVSLKNGARALHAGLEFSSISAGDQSKIQRFVHQIERQAISSGKGI